MKDIERIVDVEYETTDGETIFETLTKQDVWIFNNTSNAFCLKYCKKCIILVKKVEVIMGTQQIMSDDAQRARAIMDGIDRKSVV